MSYDDWKTTEPECSHCGSSGHTRPYCQAWKDEKAEYEEMKADEARDERAFHQLEKDEAADYAWQCYLDERGQP